MNTVEEDNFEHDSGDYHGHHHHYKHHSHSHHHHDDYQHSTWEEDTPLYEYYGEIERKKGLALFVDLLKSLKASGQVKLSDHQILITDDIGFSITHEETWDETEKLTLEIEWSPEGEANELPEEEQPIPEIS